MKQAQAVAGALLGLMFVVFGANFFFPFMPMPPPPPADSPVGMFMGATFSTGFLAYVKVFEIWAACGRPPANPPGRGGC